jgi:hypothetical protein
MYQVTFTRGDKLTIVNTPSIHDANTLTFTLFLAGVNVRLWRMFKGRAVLLA